MFRQAMRYAGEVRRLRRVVRALEKRNLELFTALRLVNESYDRLKAQHEQAVRDAELLALMSRDRRTALEFLRDAHRMDALGEAS